MENFNQWNIYKQKLEDKTSIPEFQVREIWWCALGKNIGHEQDGKNELFERPILILQKFNKEVCIVVPLTSSIKEGKYYHTLESYGSQLILSQIRLISAKRLLRFINTISRSEFYKIRIKIKSII